MRDKASPGSWQSWLTVAVGGAAMVGVFALAGGATGGERGVSSAVAAGTTSATDSGASTAGGGPDVVSLTTPRCVSDSLTGAINVADKFTGPVTLGLFAIADPQSPLVRGFMDTGQRATVLFNGVYRASFTFDAVQQGSGGYLVAVLPGSGTFDPKTQLMESQVVPTCNTVTTTLTDTATVTGTTTMQVTTTQISFTTVTQRIVVTDTCPIVTNDAVRPRIGGAVRGAAHPHVSVPVFCGPPK